MRLSFSIRKAMVRFRTLTRWLCMISASVLVFHYFIRIFVADRFIIPSESMMPALEVGDRVWACKIRFGPRIYTSLDFGNGKLRCLRLPGLGGIDAGDIVVFNNPYGDGHDDSIWFAINDVCCKRVLGCPGDRIGAVDGHCWNDRILSPVGSSEMQESLRWIYDSVYVWCDRYYAYPVEAGVWNIKNWGPLTVPAEGMTVRLDEFTSMLYRQAILYETGSAGDRDGDALPDESGTYTFSHDWYYVLGDNSPDSFDSRYFGFIPDDFIIGVVAGR